MGSTPLEAGKGVMQSGGGVYRAQKGGRQESAYSIVKGLKDRAVISTFSLYKTPVSFQC